MGVYGIFAQPNSDVSGKPHLIIEVYLTHLSLEVILFTQLVNAHCLCIVFRLSLDELFRMMIEECDGSELDVSIGLIGGDISHLSRELDLSQITSGMSVS